MASLFGTDPKQALGDDLNRLKILLKTGKTGNGNATIPGFSPRTQETWKQAT